MSAGRSPMGLFRALLAALVVASLAVFAALQGPSRAARIAGAAAASVLVDGFAEEPGPHRIPVLDVRVDPAALDSLQADLPWSGGRSVKARLWENGVAHKVRFRYRGAVTPSHYLGGKKSFRLNLKESSPWAPYRRLNVVNPKAHNMVNNHLSAWVAGAMGAPVPLDEMVFARINGEDVGVMELYEQVDGGFERNRNLWPGPVPVYKGDFPPITERKLPKGRTLWASAAHWEYASAADSAEAHAKLVRLVAAVQKDPLPLEAHRDSIAALIDVDAWLRYEAALLVTGTTHIDQYHNQWLVLNPRTGRFYPVFWDALLLFTAPGEPLYYVNDAMSWWVLRIPEWRLQRDRYAYRAMAWLGREGAFGRRLDEVLDRIRPSVLADRNKHGNVTLMPEDVHRTSVVHVIGSAAALRRGVQSYWEGMLARMERMQAQVEARGDSLRVKLEGEAPIRLQWAGGPAEVQVDGQPTAADPDGAGWSLVLHRTLRPPEGGKDHPLADKQRLEAQPMEATVAFAGGVPAGLRITNAITDEPIR